MLQVIDGYNPSTETFGAVVLGDGRKPICNLGNMHGEVLLASSWEAGQPEHVTRGQLFAPCYSEVLSMYRGVWHLQAKASQENWHDLTIDAYDCSSLRIGQQFKSKRFDGMKFKAEDDDFVIIVPEFENDDFNVMITEILSGNSGILSSAFRCLAKATLDRKGGPIYSIPSSRKKRHQVDAQSQSN